MSRFVSTGKWARACSRRPWLTIFAWVTGMVLAVMSIVFLLGNALTTQMTFTRSPESDVGRKLLEERLSGPPKSNEIVVISSADKTVDDPEFKAAATDLGQEIIGLGSGVIAGGTSYYLTGDQSLVSKDRHTTIIPLVMAGSLSDAEENVVKLIDLTEAASARTGLTILTAGDSSSSRDFNTLSETDLQKAELFGIPIALLILLAVFGTVVAAGLPLALAAVSIVAALGITALVGQRFEMSFFVANMITMMGLAVGIDYSLFVVSRYREELQKGRNKFQAIEIAGSTASRAVLFSGMTVILALLGMLIVPMSLFYSLGAGAIFVVAVAIVSTLTLLPAVLALLGERINSLKIPYVYRHGAGRGGTGRFWDAVTRMVMKRPLISAITAAAVLLIPASFYFDINTGANGIAALPESYKSRQGFMILDREFSSGLASPIKVVVDGDVNSAAVQTAISNLETETGGDETFYGIPTVKINDAGDLAEVEMPVRGRPDSMEATGAVTRLREQYIPAAFAGVDAAVYVSGAPAYNLDYFQITDNYRPIVFAFVLGLSFLLLMVVFHSLVVPLKAIIMNLLSVGAAYGLIVLVFQKGVGAGLLGFQQVEAVEAWVPVFLFSVLFGLSMDYHVFLLGRIREHYTETHDNSESVAFGLKSTGRIITGAALIMVAVFAGFASGDLVMFQQMGFGLAVAVFLDATIVRTVLVPATMKLLGDKNWYLPHWLSWLPDFHMEGEAADREVVGKRE